MVCCQKVKLIFFGKKHVYLNEQNYKTNLWGGESIIPIHPMNYDEASQLVAYGIVSKNDAVLVANVDTNNSYYLLF